MTKIFLKSIIYNEIAFFRIYFSESLEIEVFIYYLSFTKMPHEFHESEIRNAFSGPDWCGSAGWAMFCKVKGLWFDSQLGHLPSLWVQSLVRMCVRGNQLMFLSHINVSLPPFLLPFPSLKINK